jgi:hypothetical protein
MGVYDTRGGGSTHIDKVLSNISVGYPNNEFVGENLAPSVPVKKQSDIYYTFGREAWVLEPGSDVRAPGTVANEIPGIKVSTQPYFAVEHALQIPVTDEERENVDSPLAPDRDGTELVTSKILLQRELVIRGKVANTANYATGYSAAINGTALWSDYANSNPIGDVKAGRRKIHSGLFLHPNTLILPYQPASVLEDHPDFIERIKYSQAGIVTPELMAALFMIPKVVVPGVGYNSARMGQTETLGYLWADDVIMAYVPDRPGLKIPAFMYEFTWAYPGAGVQQVTRWREEQRKSDLVRVGRRYDHRFIALDATGKSIAGYLLTSVLT